MVPVKWSVGDNALAPENIVEIYCMLQWGACVCAVVKQRSSRVPHPAICSRKSGRHCAHRRRASKICWITAAHGNGGAGQEEYSVQADQGRQGPHRDREVSSTHYHPHTPTLHYPLRPIASLPCPPPLLDPLVLHSNSPSSTLFPIFLATHPFTHTHTLPCPCNHYFTTLTAGSLLLCQLLQCQQGRNCSH